MSRFEHLGNIQGTSRYGRDEACCTTFTEEKILEYKKILQVFALHLLQLVGFENSASVPNY